MKKIPVVATNLGFFDIVCNAIKSNFNKINYQQGFSEELKKITNSKHCLLFNSGTAAFCIALKSLSELSNKKEVIIPAYTPLALIVAIKKSGLKTVLCDISLNTLNLNIEDLKNKVTKNTLCIMPVYLFGIFHPIDEILKIARNNNIFVLDDCAQSFLVDSKEKGDVVLISFNRGKNFTTFSGGALLGNNDEIFESIYKNYNEIPKQNLLTKFDTFIKLLAFSLIKNKYLYNLLYFVIKKFKDERIPVNIKVKKYTDWQSSIGLNLLKKIDELNKTRYNNTIGSIEGFKKYDIFQIPNINEMSHINRFPLIVKDIKIKEKIINNLTKKGIEVSTMYNKPVHHIFDLGYKKDEFPNAIYLADHLIALPVHPLVTREEINYMIEEIKKCFL